MKGGFYKAVSEDWLTDFDELRVTTLKLMKVATNSRKLGKGMVHLAWSRKQTP